MLRLRCGTPLGCRMRLQNRSKTVASDHYGQETVPKLDLKVLRGSVCLTLLHSDQFLLLY